MTTCCCCGANLNWNVCSLTRKRTTSSCDCCYCAPYHGSLTTTTRTCVGWRSCCCCYCAPCPCPVAPCLSRSSYGGQTTMTTTTTRRTCACCCSHPCPYLGGRTRSCCCCCDGTPCPCRGASTRSCCCCCSCVGPCRCRETINYAFVGKILIPTSYRLLLLCSFDELEELELLCSLSLSRCLSLLEDLCLLLLPLLLLWWFWWWCPLVVTPFDCTASPQLPPFCTWTFCKGQAIEREKEGRGVRNVNVVLGVELSYYF